MEQAGLSLYVQLFVHWFVAPPQISAIAIESNVSAENMLIGLFSIFFILNPFFY